MSQICWQRIINSKYLQLSKDKKKANADAWNANRLSHQQLCEQENLEWQNNNSVWNSVSMVLNPIQELPPVKSLPRMISWTQSTGNVLVEDEIKLFNVPYIDEEVVANDDRFYKELADSYEIKQNTEQDSSWDLDDEVFLKLIEYLVDYYKEHVPIRHISQEIADNKTKLPPSIIFTELCKYFPKKRLECLIERYKTLTKIETIEAVPNIDGPTAEINSREKSLDSFRKLFCRRCYVYNCLLHKDDKDFFLVKRSPEMVPSKQPCGISCYLTTTTELDSDRLKSWTKENDTNEDKDENIWLPSEISVLTAIHKIYGSNYCVMATIIMTKNCQEVCQYLRENVPTVSTVSTVATSDIVEECQEPENTVTNPRLWYNHLKKLRSDSTTEIKRIHYTPCNHAGPCDQATSCSCIEAPHFCEKFCGCNGSKCSNRFLGCDCKSSCSRNSCRCFLAFRECDPDVCHSCGSHLLDFNKITCKNICIQRRQGKKLAIAMSEISGWGAFLRESCRENEFIAEYVGEVITHSEAERRGKIYDKRKISFLFDLNDQYAVDAQRQGDIIRFANHSSKPNCITKILMVNGDHRVGIFAKRDIMSNEELFFDYSYPPLHCKHLLAM